MSCLLIIVDVVESNSSESTKISSNIPYVVLESTRAAVGIRTRSNITMTVAAVDGDPPFPPAHTPCATFDPSDTCCENESNPFDDWFLFDDEPFGTDGYGATTVEESNRRTDNHHDLPPNPSAATRQPTFPSLYHPNEST